MCRMFVSIGIVPKKELVESFLIEAQGLGELNEVNTKPKEYQHKDGWGSVYKENGVYKIYKSALPCWEDPELKKIEEKEIVMMHARHATVGSKSKENSHPFQKTHNGKKWYFCHNGTIHDELPEFDNLTSDTDSEKLFRMILKNFDEDNDISSIEAAIKNLSDYSSLNSFLYNGKFLYAINNYREDPKYYNMNMFRSKDTLIFSSEKFDLKTKAGDEGWSEMKKNQIVRVKIANMQVDLF